MVKCSCPFGDCRISSEKIYVPCPHGSSNDMVKCDVFSIIRATACSAFLMGGNRGNINDMTILFLDIKPLYLAAMHHANLFLKFGSSDVSASFYLSPFNG